MKFKNTNIAADAGVLYNSHYIAVAYDCSKLAALATDGVIKAGTIVPANDATAFGVLLHDVVLAENPNGTAVVDGFINVDKLPTAPSAAALAALPKLTFMTDNGKMVKKVAVKYNKNNAASGTAPTDSSSPYAYGATVTVSDNTGLLVGPEDATVFYGWNTAADGSGKAYKASDTFKAEDDTILYAQFGAGYTVTYNAGAAASGTAPTDSSSPYAPDATVSVLGNTGTLVGPTGTTTFDGWNTKADGTGTAYAANDTFAIKGDVTLYAQFKA